ncbi:MAG: Slp family lipoprotein [Acidiferrobacterales bacterium]
MKKLCYRFIFFSLLLLIASCASNVPKEISSSPSPKVGLVAAQKIINAHIGKPVRWGGMIIRIDNQQDKSILEILAKPLNTYGQPIPNVASPGRFLVEITGFVDPSLYAPGREMTVYGTLTGLRKKKIGEHNYDYPVVNGSKYYLWTQPVNTGYYDPYWDGYWGYGYSYGYPGPYLWHPWGYQGHHGYLH